MLVFSAEALKVSATRLVPGYDGIDYIALGRQVARDGGIVGTIRCYLQGRCREDNRPPLYQLLLSPLLDDSPAAFARAKLLDLVVGALLSGIGVAVIRRQDVASGRLGGGGGALSHAGHAGVRLAHHAGRALGGPDARRGARRRGLPGARRRRLVRLEGLVGLAFLTKGSGHLLWAPLLATSVYRHRAALPRRATVYAAAVGFLAVSLFLVWRNWKLWREPFHNLNAGEVWIDHWRDVFVLRLSPEHAQLGLRWYLAQHSLLHYCSSSAGAPAKSRAYSSTRRASASAIRSPAWSRASEPRPGLGSACGDGGATASAPRWWPCSRPRSSSSPPWRWEPAARRGRRFGTLLPYVILIVPYAALELVVAFGRASPRDWR